ncbi:zinc finger protein 853-like [Amphiprion ocellaris]|uniref:zinc finger protein 853-like n=1 Tax=Amphiprion ocellaris TaxID=80972 RepID=UPI002410BBC5|nr:zinc finger protein 853-like [Amphiprion ocellaris]
MSSVQNLRELINQRLTAAAEEIFTEFEKTIVQYEEELDRQRRLLDNIWKPQITQHTAELPQQQICKEEEVPTEQNVCIQERNSSVDQENPETLQIKEEQEELPTNLDQEDTEPPQMREEEEELCNSLDRQQSGQTAAADRNQKADSFMLVQCKSKCEELSREKFCVSENTTGHYEKEINRQRRLFNITQNLQIKLHRIDLQQQDIYQEQEVFIDHLLPNQERNFCLDQKDPEPLQMKEAQEELCISLDQDNLEPPQIKEEQEELCTNLDQEAPEPPQKREKKEELCTSWDRQQSGQSVFKSQDLQQQHIYQEQEVFTDHLYCKRERSFCLDQKDPEPLQMKEAQEKLCISMDPDNLEPPQIKEEQELFSDQGGEQFGFCPDQEGSKHPDSGSTKNLVLKTQDRNSSHSNNVDSSSMSRIHCDADTRKKTQTCDVCGKSFKYKSALKTHYRSHTGERPFACEKCGKSFTQRHHMIVHMRTHTDEKLYLCKVCGQRFYGLARFQRHRAIHKDENLFL